MKKNEGVVPMNFHHLQYFWAVARDGNLTRTARRLRVAPSALSSQIRQLEAQLGRPLFEREGRGLALTEAGEIALAYAEDIFAAGRELVVTLDEGRRRQQVLRVGAVATLSRNFQRSFVRPLLGQGNVRLRLSAGSLEELLDGLAAHALDVVLSNRAAPGGPERGFRSRRLARQPVSLVSTRRLEGFSIPGDLGRWPMILPGPASEVRSEFDALCERLGVRVRVLAEVDDMATMRVLARDGDALALVPSVVVRDELRDGVLHEVCTLPEVAESFFAISVDRRYPHPLLGELLERDEAELLGLVEDRPAGVEETPPAAPRARAPRRRAKAREGER
jgi:LysR family transcriptional activator of nhaA